MPTRFPYVGTAGLAGSGYPSIPVQAEAQAFFARFLTAPSSTFRNALNQAIFRWKSISVYSLISDLWLTCADTQADSVRNLISAARDATLTGAPTFTALSGFSGLGASNYISFPFTTSGLTAATSGACFAGSYDNTQADGTAVGDGITGHVGGFILRNTTNKLGLTPAVINPTTAGYPTQVVLGSSGSTAAFPTGAPQTGGGSGGAGAFTATPISFNTAMITKVSVYGFLSGATLAQTRKFLSILQTFLEDVGALT